MNRMEVAESPEVAPLPFPNLSLTVSYSEALSYAQGRLKMLGSGGLKPFCETHQLTSHCAGEVRWETIHGGWRKAVDLSREPGEKEKAGTREDSGWRSVSEVAMPLLGVRMAVRPNSGF